MDTDSDHNAGFGVGRRQASSSRDSSPAPKRHKRSFSPASDNGDLVASVAHEDAETPTPENIPLIRQAVGFSSVNTSVNTYQATVDPPPVASYFLPGQAPPAPPKPKTTRPRAARKKKGEQYSDRTGRFRLIACPATTLANSSGVGPAGVIAHSSARSMPPATNFVPNRASGVTEGSSNLGGTPIGVAAPLDARRPNNTSDKKRPISAKESFNQSSARPSLGQAATNHTYTTPQHHTYGGSSTDGPRRPDPQVSYSMPPGVAPGGTSVGQSNPSTAISQAPPPNPNRPLRMLTLLIEDLRSGVPDPQLAEVRVPLRVADDPEDGFWAEAVEVCNALQAGPSRIDGPAKVYTMRGRFRQFFMRVDQCDQLQVQQAHLGVSKERTLSVFVEAPMPQGHLPRPPIPPSDACRNSVSEQSSPSATYSRPTYSLVTRERQIERLSKSNYARPARGRMSPVSESGSYGHSRRTSPNARHRSSRQDHYASSSQRPLSPPIPGRLADTQEEIDNAIANYIRSHIENHSGWMDYMQSTAQLQRVSEVLRQYNFVEDRVRELAGIKTPTHWDGAPNCIVEKQHVWRVLKLNDEWGEECQETLDLVAYYGKGGSRYEDSRVVDMIDDTSSPKPNTMQKFLRLLRDIDESFTQDAASGQLPPILARGRSMISGS